VLRPLYFDIVMAKDKLPDGNRFDLRARVENEAVKKRSAPH